MEKYSKFRDEATGIAPFQEPKGSGFNLFQSALIWILALFSSAFSLVTVTLYFGIARWLLPVVVSRFFLNYWVLLPLRVLYSTFYYEGERRASVRKRSIRKAGPGDVLLANFVSPLDPLLFESHHKTFFAFPTCDGHFESVSIFGVVRRALSAQLPRQTGVSLSSLSTQAQKSGALLVVFVEGTTTNGRGLLTLKNLGVRDIALLESQVYAAAIKYTPPSAVSPTPSTFICYIWRLSRASLWYMASIRVSGEPIPKNTLTRDQVSKNITAVGRLRILGDRLDVYSKQDYLDLRAKKRTN